MTSIQYKNHINEILSDNNCSVKQKNLEEFTDSSCKYTEFESENKLAALKSSLKNPRKESAYKSSTKTSKDLCEIFKDSKVMPLHTSKSRVSFHFKENVEAITDETVRYFI